MMLERPELCEIILLYFKVSLPTPADRLIFKETGRGQTIFSSGTHSFLKDLTRFSHL
jgi:hypothetical protein